MFAREEDRTVHDRYVVAKVFGSKVMAQEGAAIAGASPVAWMKIAEDAVAEARKTLATAEGPKAARAPEIFREPPRCCDEDYFFDDDDEDDDWDSRDGENNKLASGATLAMVEELIRCSPDPEYSETNGEGGGRKPKRPCQGKRMRYRGFSSYCKRRILEDPDLDLSALDVPSFLLRNDDLRAAMWADLEWFRAKVKAIVRTTPIDSAGLSTNKPWYVVQTAPPPPLALSSLMACDRTPGGPAYLVRPGEKPRGELAGREMEHSSTRRLASCGPVECSTPSTRPSSSRSWASLGQVIEL